MEDVMEPASNVPNGPNKSKGCDRKDATNEDKRMVGADRQMKSPRRSPRKNPGNMLKRSLNVADSPPDLKNKKIRIQENQSQNRSAQRDAILSGKQKKKSASRLFSARSSLPENDIVTAIATERDSTAVDRQGSYEELKVMIQELRDENISMKKMLVKILETV